MPRSETARCGFAPGTWPSVADDRFSSSRRCATRPPSETGFATGPPARPSPTPANLCSDVCARSSSPSPSSMPASTSVSTRRSRRRRPCAPCWGPSDLSAARQSRDSRAVLPYPAVGTRMSAKPRVLIVDDEPDVSLTGCDSSAAKMHLHHRHRGRTGARRFWRANGPTSSSPTSRCPAWTGCRSWPGPRGGSRRRRDHDHRARERRVRGRGHAGRSVRLPAQAAAV